MKTIIATATLLSLAPNLVYGIVCNADNVLRALQNNAAKASPFCSTYTRPPPNQPLPTYVSQYPASRVSSGCTCLITPTTTSAPCQSSGNFIKDGDFQTENAGNVSPWEFANPVNPNSGQESRASLVRESSGNNYASLKVQNGPSGGYGATYISQTIPALCSRASYRLQYEYGATITSGTNGLNCRLEINLNDRQLEFLDGLTQDIPYRTIMKTFTYSGTASAQALTFRWICSAPSGMLVVDNVSLVGLGYLGPR